ncbi:MAG: EamA family transporter [Devosia nanyangense]|uniref:EamA family transporter n=1 Tax=Devosia nanyangense TaxID=1228055 RepID=A0A933NYS9_9HYPH|nr:EamA family transporter [Devosia nanyangense]
MSLSVFAIVLFAAALHAGWNAVVKGASDTLLTAVLIAGFAAVIALCLLPFLPPMAAASWGYICISAVLQIVYYALVAGAYRISDMSRTYPLMRGMPPVLVAVASTVALGVTLSVTAWIGVGLISAGLLSLLLATGGVSDPRGMRLAALNALVIAAYTLVDGAGVRLSGAPATYVMWIFVANGVPMALWALLWRPEVRIYAIHNWAYGLVGAVGTLASYGLALWAMTEAPIPVVAALRETSILFGTAIAAFVLKEKVTQMRLAAVLVIALGAATLRLA